MAVGSRTEVFLGFHEQRKLDVAYRVIHGQLSIEQAATLLQKSYRQTRRIVSRIKMLGALGTKHGNFGRVPVNKSSSATRRVIVDLLRDQYFDFNLAHFREHLASEHGIQVARETLRRWAKAEGLVRRARKSRRRGKTHKLRPRLPRAGMLLQLDGSSHRWLGQSGPECALIGAIDDATSHCAYAEFFPGEDTISVLSTLKSIVERVGVPEVLYVDQAGHFGKRYNRSQNLEWERHLTHVERAMEELGCRVLFAHSPQAKGRIERMWGTFQDRLVPELRLKGIERVPSANAYLHEQFIPEFNRKFSVAPADKRSAFKPVPDMWKDRLEWVFCIREFRKVGMGETISWNGTTYVVNNSYGLTLKRCQIEIRTCLSGQTQAFFAGRPVTLNDVGNTALLNSKAA